ncbi:MAG TPA: amylo-alpha-1,6-glucosidase [Kofleriaceae bacterium]|nr:amylo-alpha-1,6-glucosidase [Kofleriaceae bacterium]
MSASEDAIWVRDRYYILATSALADDRTRVLKHGDTFAVFDRRGDVRTVGTGQQGLFHGDTRMLSRLELFVGGARPLLLSSTVTDDNSVLAVDLANPDLDLGDGLLLARDTVHILRAVCVWQKTCSMRLRLHSFGSEVVRLPLQLSFDADFADMFEVRGTPRERRGDILIPVVGDAAVRLSYRGLDRRTRSAAIRFDPPPELMTASTAQWNIQLEPGQEQVVRVEVTCDDGAGAAAGAVLRFEDARAARVASIGASGACEIETSNEVFDAWLRRSASDLRMMLSDTPTGPYPYAGVPWFSCPFGRDGIVTAFETLWVDPDIAAGVLRFLSATQATAVIAEKDAEPGKILHEMRSGEMAALGEVPFGSYYGTADATPLFVMLAAAHLEATGDLALAAMLWPHVERALGWIEKYGDVDGDGLVEYERHTERGLANQGWKDSPDSVSHADGELAHAPIALCEVQAYVHAAWGGAARMAAALGRDDRAAACQARADAVRERFEAAFWCEEIGTYAIALDGAKRPCQVRSSNAGHVLWCGTASPGRAEQVGRALMADDSFTGWGVRTLSARERRYNPMSYHNGSVWPHDNALVAAGLARYGMREPAVAILRGLFEASQHVELHRLPELFCGFPRRPAEGPTRYPVACSPQAWAAGAVYLLLQSCLGLTVDGAACAVRFTYPVLPDFLERVCIRGLRVADARVDLELHRHPGGVGLHVTRREGRVEVFAVQ